MSVSYENTILFRLFLRITVFFLFLIISVPNVPTEIFAILFALLRIIWINYLTKYFKKNYRNQFMHCNWKSLKVEKKHVFFTLLYQQMRHFCASLDRLLFYTLKFSEHIKQQRMHPSYRFQIKRLSEMKPVPVVIKVDRFHLWFIYQTTEAKSDSAILISITLSEKSKRI